MKKKLIAYLSHYSKDPDKIDRILVSLYFSINKLSVKNNRLLSDILISDSENGYKKIREFSEDIESMTLEDLFEIFEYVLSPKEKVVTGAVYTPLKIRQFIVSQTLVFTDEIKIADIACGCGGFLMTAAEEIHRTYQKKISDIISQNLWGLDIAGYSVKRTKLILSLLALKYGEDVNLNFNLFVGNALDFNWSASSSKIYANDGFDLIIGNPPYVCSRNLDEKSKKLLEKWDVSKSGHPDLYIPFFQIGLENLRLGGTLGYITVNTFFKSINGRSLREYFSEKCYSFKIIDFKNEQVFKKRNTYTCICLITRTESLHIDYTSFPSSRLDEISDICFTKNEYTSFNNRSGWNLVSESSQKSVLEKIEGCEGKIFSHFSFSTGIATLKNNVYIFNPLREDRNYFYLKNKNDEIEYRIEKAICRNVINSNKITIESKIEFLKRKIIFPYRWNEKNEKYTAITEAELHENYPCTYDYFVSKREILAQRDKGDGQYEEWFAYGRNQGLNVKGFKLFLPHITNKPRFVFSSDEKLLFCNGEAVVSESKRELLVLKKVLESEIFWYYILKTSKPYSSGYMSLGKNYIKEFSFPFFTENEKEFLLRTESRGKVLTFLLRKYKLKRTDILHR